MGTSGWTAPGWLGTVYPRGTKQADFIEHYAKRYNTVEIDATFYSTPAPSTVAGWRAKTPDGFQFAAKVPQVVTHTKRLVDCQHEMNHFLEVMSGLGPKLGPLLFQFPYYTKKDGVTEDDFLAMLVPFLKTLPQVGFRFALECRNKKWMNPALFTILHEHRIACCLIDHPWMSRPANLFQHNEIITAPFSYIRWIGNRKEIEKMTKVWDRSIVDRERELAEWAPYVRRLIDEKIEVFGYMNNHFSGHAPADIDRFVRMVSLP